MKSRTMMVAVCAGLLFGCRKNDRDTDVEVHIRGIASIINQVSATRPLVVLLPVVPTMQGEKPHVAYVAWHKENVVPGSDHAQCELKIDPYDHSQWRVHVLKNEELVIANPLPLPSAQTLPTKCSPDFSYHGIADFGCVAHVSEFLKKQTLKYDKLYTEKQTASPNVLGRLEIGGGTYVTYVTDQCKLAMTKEGETTPNNFYLANELVYKFVISELLKLKIRKLSDDPKTVPSDFVTLVSTGNPIEIRFGNAIDIFPPKAIDSANKTKHPHYKAHYGVVGLQDGPVPESTEDCGGFRADPIVYCGPGYVAERP
jgi:hypothetical protein